MKMYKKSELNIVDGYVISNDGSILDIDDRIVMQANRLETLKQEIEYLKAQPSAVPAPSLEKFERQSIRNLDLEFTVDTPMLDAKVDEAIGIMDELDAMNTADRANEMLEYYKELITFAKADYVVGSDNGCPLLIDTPTLGSILELTGADIIDIIATSCGMDGFKLSITDEA